MKQRPVTSASGDLLDPVPLDQPVFDDRVLLSELAEELRAMPARSPVMRCALDRVARDLTQLAVKRTSA